MKKATVSDSGNGGLVRETGCGVGPVRPGHFGRRGTDSGQQPLGQGSEEGGG